MILEKLVSSDLIGKAKGLVEHSEELKIHLISLLTTYENAKKAA